MQDETRESLRDAWDRWGCFGTLGLAVLLLVMGFWIVNRDGSPNIGADVRSVAFLDAEGRRHILAEYSGKVVVVDVWATWCPPCRASLPEIAAFQAAAQGRYVVLPISVDDSGFGAVNDFLNQQSGALKTMKAFVPANAGALDAFGAIQGIPTTILIGADGKIRTRWSGYYAGRTESELKSVLGN